MSRITFLDNVFQGKYYNYFTALYRRNKTLLMVSTAIFFFSMFMGYVFSGQIDQFMKNVLTSLRGKFSREGITTTSLFLNNLQSTFIIYVGGIIGILTLIALFINGLLIGYVVTKYPISIIYILPHGIFEIPALIIAGAAGFRITSMIIRILISLIKDKPINKHYWEFKDSLVLFAITIGLLLIAAFIEANITRALGDYVISLV